MTPHLFRSTIFVVGMLGCLSSCGHLISPEGDRGQRAAVAIRRAIHYLADEQVTAEEERRGERSYAGDWPQTMSIKPRRVRFTLRDSNAFAATFVHHALSHVTRDNAVVLGIGERELVSAREMRVRVIDLVRGFEEPAGSSAAGSYGYWKRPAREARPLERIASRRMLRRLGGPAPGGALAPRHRLLPPELMLWPDSDTTAVVFASLQEHAELEGGMAQKYRVDQLVRWRDLPGNRRGNPDASYLERDSGVFLTWLDEPTSGKANDADLTVNANILFALAKINQPRTPGFSHARDWVLRATREGHHHKLGEVCFYYDDILYYQYAVSRAYHEGPVPSLKPAVDQLVAELERGARSSRNGGLYWESADPVMSTACAVLTLLNGEGEPRLVEGGIRHLLEVQQRDGGWRGGWQHYFTSESGIELFYRSDAWVSAFALEALCRYQLQQAGAD